MAAGESKNRTERKGGERGGILESHPSPHGEQTTGEMPIETDHSSTSHENVAQTPNTVDNQMNPSVAHGGEDPTSDSMFNNADPQTAELLKKDTGGDRATTQPRNIRRRKTG
jgi:hypothetical protein